MLLGAGVFLRFAISYGSLVVQLQSPSRHDDWLYNTTSLDVGSVCRRRCFLMRRYFRLARNIASGSNFFTALVLIVSCVYDINSGYC